MVHNTWDTWRYWCKSVHTTRDTCCYWCKVVHNTWDTLWRYWCKSVHTTRDTPAVTDVKWSITPETHYDVTGVNLSIQLETHLLLLFRYPFHPRVTAVARKRPRSFCQKRRWQVTAKHAYTLCMWLCMKWHGAWLYSVHKTRRDGSRFLWHQPCQLYKYTTSVDIQLKTRYKKLFTHVESHASAVSLLESRE